MTSNTAWLLIITIILDDPLSDKVYIFWGGSSLTSDIPELSPGIKKFFFQALNL